MAETDKKEEQPLRLELDLTDGSRVVGVPGIESVPVQTPYAKMDLPLKQICACWVSTTASIAEGRVVFDNLKIWDFAKTDFSDRRDE